MWISFFLSFFVLFVLFVLVIVILELVAGTIVFRFAYRGGCIWAVFCRFAFCVSPFLGGGGVSCFAFARAFLMAGSYGRCCAGIVSLGVFAFCVVCFFVYLRFVFLCLFALCLVRFLV